jgi:hypothetical protein
MKEITCKNPSRKDLDELEKRLLASMKNQNAKKKGICHIREKLHY